MATQPVVTKVWIEPGCIVCDACETTAPTVFEVTEDNCVIRPEALHPNFTKPLSQAIIDAALECPVDVIKYESVAEEAPAAAAGKPQAASAPAKASPAPTKPATKSPEAPAPKRVAEPATATAAKAPTAVKTSVAGAPDPAIAALLRAATSRGGNVVIQKRAESLPPGVEALQKKDPRELPPDARQAKVLEAAKKVREESDANRRELLGTAALATGWVAFGVGVGVSVGPALRGRWAS